MKFPSTQLPKYLTLVATLVFANLSQAAIGFNELTASVIVNPANDRDKFLREYDDHNTGVASSFVETTDFIANRNSPQYATFKGSGSAKSTYGTLQFSGSFDLQNYEAFKYSADYPVSPFPVFSAGSFEDTLTISGSSGTGYLKVTTLVEEYSSFYSDYSYRLPEDVFSWGGFDISSEVALNQLQSQTYYFKNDNLNKGLVTKKIESELIPFTYNSPLSIRVAGGAALFTMDSVLDRWDSYNAVGQYSYTINLTDLSVFSDATGLNQTNFSLTASSGTLYPVSVLTSVPEIDSYAMMLAGFGVLAFAVRRKQLA